jgi:gas vesicle protein GvpL/GvpF
VIYAYAVCHRDAVDPPPRRRGFGGAALRVAVVDGLAAVYTRHRTLRPRPSPEAMWTHERTVQKLMDRGTVLPMRFGAVLEDEAALIEALTARRDGLVTCLEQVRGRVELGVRVVADRGAGPDRDAEDGRAYLLARVEQYRRAEQAARDVHAPLARLACDSRVQSRTVAPTLFAGAYLVERDAVQAFRAEVDRAAVVVPGVRAVCTGPWPPYSFVDTEET